jgi:hypothetical protein
MFTYDAIIGAITIILYNFVILFQRNGYRICFRPFNFGGPLTTVIFQIVNRARFIILLSSLQHDFAYLFFKILKAECFFVRHHLVVKTIKVNFYFCTKP